MTNIGQVVQVVQVEPLEASATESAARTRVISTGRSLLDHREVEPAVPVTT